MRHAPRAVSRDAHAAYRTNILWGSGGTERPNNVTLKVNAPAFKTASLSKKALRSAAIFMETSDAVRRLRFKVSATELRLSISGSCDGTGVTLIAPQIYQTQHFTTNRSIVARLHSVDRALETDR